ncbi:MAG TPA: hypothetical protein VK165_06590 [Azonexus sp.]|nr:hypothetical protein [Azonexus sp.]
MSAWRDFLDGLFPPGDKPGEVMICFVNRYLEGLDGIKYKIKFDGMEKAGVTTEESYSVTLKPKSFKPIQIFVWSRTALAFKQLDDVVPELGKKKLVRKMLKTVKTTGNPRQVPKKADSSPPQKPTPSTAGPSPVGNQGQIPKDGKNENGQPQAIPARPVPTQITTEQLRKIFPKNKGGIPTDTHLQEVADELNRDLPKYKLDTPTRRAHFFGQIKRESPQLSGAAESLNYTPTGLIATFGYYKKHKSEAETDGRLEEKGKDGKKKITRAADEEVIGNKVYGPKGKAADLGNKENGDGWRFRGRGMKQTTGRFNYGILNDRHKALWSEDVDFVANPDLVCKMPYAVRSAVVFWIANSCWQAADGGISDSAIDAVTKIVNAGELANHNAGKYTDNNNPVICRRSYTKLAYAAFT